MAIPVYLWLKDDGGADIKGSVNVQSREGSVEVRVGGVCRGARQVQLSIDVVDSGIGLPGPDDAALYTHFYQVDGSMTREHGGLGIGLAICRQLMALQGGELSHESAPGGGTQFRLSLTLPLAGQGEEPVI